MTDNVNNPAHYGQGKIECIDYIQDFLTHEEFVGYLRGNVAKYLHRWRYKNGLEDLRKAQWYLNKMIDVERMHEWEQRADEEASVLRAIRPMDDDELKRSLERSRINGVDVDATLDYNSEQPYA